MHTIRTSSALQGYTSFPYALQVFSIDRQTTNLGEKSLRRETAYGVTRLSPQQAGPERLLQLVRGHRKTENRVHWVRDVTFDADRSQVRTCAGRRTLTSLRNLAISL
ncbi:MAG TPA: ISAs1 family transposase, partial [Clostridiales bacterium UBA8153]|nr:ISAs1 family transposase [Clostridiales bacterium UBA8153]